MGRETGLGQQRMAGAVVVQGGGTVRGGAVTVEELDDLVLHLGLLRGLGPGFLIALEAKLGGVFVTQGFRRPAPG